MKILLASFLFAGILFLMHLLIPYPVGNDAVYFFGVGCNWNVETQNIYLIPKLFFQSIGCNLILFKIVGAVLAFFCFFIIGKTAQLLNKKNGWVAIPFSFFSLAMPFGLIQLEDDLLALPFLFLSNYFFLKGFLEKKERFYFLALILIVFTGLFFWRGAVVYLLSLSFFFLPSRIIIISALLFIKGFGSEMIISIFPYFENQVIEELPLLGLQYQYLGWLGLFLVYEKIWLFIPFLFFAFLKAKYAIHLSFWLAIGVIPLIKLFQTNSNLNQKFPEILIKNLTILVLIMGLLFSIAQGYALLHQYPTPNQIQAIKETIELSKKEKLKINNDWALGYYIRFYGGQPNHEAGGKINTSYLKNSITLSEKKFIQCIEIKNFGMGYQNNLILQKC